MHFPDFFIETKLKYDTPLKKFHGDEIQSVKHNTGKIVGEISFS